VPQQSTPVPGTATGNLREFLTNVLQINGWMLEAQQAPLKVPHPRKLCLDFLPHIRGVPLVHIHGAATPAQPPLATYPPPATYQHYTPTTGNIHTWCHNTKHTTGATQHALLLWDMAVWAGVIKSACPRDTAAVLVVQASLSTTRRGGLMAGRCCG
jgi:hypothetical protein